MLQQIEARGVMADPLIIDLESEGPFRLKDAPDGLGPVKATVNTTPFSIFDGELYTGSVIGKRNIVMNILLSPDWVDQSMESLRNELYAYFMPKSLVKLRFISTHMIPCEISGFVEGFEPNMFSEDSEIQISVICPDPDFLALDYTTVGGLTPSTSDPATVINYPGSVPAGFQVRIDPSGSKPSYTGTLNAAVVYAGTDVMQMSVSGTVDHSNRIHLNTVPGQKRAVRVNGSGVQTANLLPYLVVTEKWPQLQKGENLVRVFTGSDDGAGLNWAVDYRARFGGL